jgi:hypothetical protein
VPAYLKLDTTSVFICVINCEHTCNKKEDSIQVTCYIQIYDTIYTKKKGGGNSARQNVTISFQVKNIINISWSFHESVCIHYFCKQNIKDS